MLNYLETICTFGVLFLRFLRWDQSGAHWRTNDSLGRKLGQSQDAHCFMPSPQDCCPLLPLVQVLEIIVACILLLLFFFVCSFFLHLFSKEHKYSLSLIIPLGPKHKFPLFISLPPFKKRLNRHESFPQAKIYG